MLRLTQSCYFVQIHTDSVPIHVDYWRSGYTANNLKICAIAQISPLVYTKNTYHNKVTETWLEDFGYRFDLSTQVQWKFSWTINRALHSNRYSRATWLSRNEKLKCKTWTFNLIITQYQWSQSGIDKYP